MATTKYKLNSRGYYETKVWDGTYTPSGAKHRKTLISRKSSADLEKKVAAYKKTVDERVTSNSSMTFGQYASQWLEISKASKELNTRKMYAGIVNRYFHGINNIRLQDLRHSHFQQIINENLEHPKTCKNIKQTFTQIIKSAVRDRYLPREAIEDITADISLPKYIKPAKRPLTALEKQALLDADLDERKRVFVSILYYCGLRRGEALALTKSDFDLDANTVQISKVIVFDGNAPVLKPYPKSDNGLRHIPLHTSLRAILIPYLDKVTGPLFEGQETPYMTEIAYRRMWESIVTSMNVAAGYNPQQKKPKPVRPITGLTAHIFRHNFCTELCYKVPAISTKMIARLMGDTEKVVLNVYSHIIEERENVAEVLEDVFSDNKSDI